MITTISFSFGVFPFALQLRGGFPGTSTKGQICLREEFQLGEMNMKQRITSLVGQVVLLILRFRFMDMIARYVKGQNLNMRTFAQFGGTQQRNIFSINQTSFYLLICILSILLDNAFITFFQLYRPELHKNTKFLIHYLVWIVLLHFFFSIYVPIRHIIMSRQCLPSLWVTMTTEAVNNTPKFYVRQPSFIPRRNEVMMKEINMDHQRPFSYVSKSLFKNKAHIVHVQPVNKNIL